MKRRLPLVGVWLISDRRLQAGYAHRFHRGQEEAFVQARRETEIVQAANLAPDVELPEQLTGELRKVLGMSRTVMLELDRIVGELEAARP